MQLSDSDLAKIIYRDDISIKHGGRERLAQELEDKANLSSKRVDSEQTAICDTKARTSESGALSKALVQYLLKATVLLERKGPGARGWSRYCIPTNSQPALFDTGFPNNMKYVIGIRFIFVV